MIGFCDICGLVHVHKPVSTAATVQALVACNRCWNEWAVKKPQPDKTQAAKAAGKAGG